jgi:hypothetical protein
MGADKNSSRRRWRLQQDEHGFQHTSPTHYPSWRSPRSHWSATGPRNQQTTFRAKTHQHAQQKLAWLAACAALVRPMACVGQTGDTGQTRWTVPVRPVATAAAQEEFKRASATSLGPGTKPPPKTQPALKKNTTQNLTNQLQTDQELTSSTKTQRHTSQAVHPRQIPQVDCTGHTGQEHGSDLCNLGSSG